MWESRIRLKPNSKGNKPFFASTPQLCKSRGPVKRAGCYNLTLFRWYKRSLPVYWDLSTEKRMTLLSYIRGLVFASGIACYLIKAQEKKHPTPVLLPGESHGRRAWWAAVHGVAKSWTRLSDFTFTFHFHALEKEMATHCSVLAWRIPGTAEPGGLPSMGSHRVRHDWSNLAVVVAREKTEVRKMEGR